MAFNPPKPLTGQSPAPKPSSGGSWVSNPETQQNVWVGSSKPVYSQGPSSGSYTGGGSSGGGSYSTPKAPTIYTSNILQQSFTSQDAMQKAEREYTVQKAKENLQKFSKQGGLITPGQSPIKIKQQDIKTDSQAIKTATQIADEKIKEKGYKPARFFGIPDQPTGQKINTVEKTQTFSTGRGARFGSPTTVTIEYKNNGKAYYQGTSIEVPKDIQYRLETGIPLEETAQDIGMYVSLIGPTVGIVGSKVLSGVSKISKPITQGANPIIKSGLQTLSSAADDVFKLLSPQSQQFVTSTIVPASKTVTSAATKKTSKDVAKFVTTQGVSFAGYNISAQAPETSRQTFDFLNVSQAEKFKQFETQKDYDIISKAYTAAQVKTYGGKEEIDGEISAVESTTNPIEGFVASSLPVTRITNPTFVKEWETRFEDEYKDDARYKKLSNVEKEEFKEYKKGKELIAGQIGGGLGQLGTEVSSEIGASGLKFLAFDKLTRGGGAVRTGLTSAILTAPYGGAEGFTQVVTEASAERRQALPEDIILGTASGVVTSSLFAGVPDYLRFGVDATGKGAVKSTVKKTIKETGKSTVEKSADITKNLLATGIDVAGNILDLAEKPGDIAAIPIKTGLGVRTITLTGSRTSTDTTSKLPDQGTSPAPSKASTDSKPIGIVSPDGTINITQPGVTPVPSKTDDGFTPVPGKTDVDTDTDDKTDDKTDTDTETQTNVPSTTFTNVPSTVPVIAPQQFFFPGFFPIGSSKKQDTRGQTRVYDELAAAGKRFQQLSGLPFTQSSTKRPSTVKIGGQEYKLGKRVRKK